MFFGSYSGLVAFFPGQAIGHKFVAPVVLTNFRLSGQPVTIGRGALKQPIWSASSLELSARSILSFDFSALSYTDPARTQYRYRLEELEPGWNEADSTHSTVTYTTLPAGDYTLRVQVRTTRGDWSETGVALPIRIQPPWYGTWLFRALCAAVFLTIVWASHRQRVRHLQHEFKKLRDVIDTIPAMAWTVHQDGSGAFVNRRWVELRVNRSRHVRLRLDGCTSPRRSPAIFGEVAGRSCCRRALRSRSALSLRRDRGIPVASGRGVPCVVSRENCQVVWNSHRHRRSQARRKRARTSSDGSRAHQPHKHDGRMSASIAHEVNQPLSGVVSNGSACLRWLAGETPNLEEAREAARRIVRDGKRAVKWSAAFGR